MEMSLIPLAHNWPESVIKQMYNSAHPIFLTYLLTKHSIMVYVCFIDAMIDQSADYTPQIHQGLVKMEEKYRIYFNHMFNAL